MHLLMVIFLYQLIKSRYNMRKYCNMISMYFHASLTLTRKVICRAVILVMTGSPPPFFLWWGVMWLALSTCCCVSHACSHQPSSGHLGSTDPWVHLDQFYANAANRSESIFYVWQVLHPFSVSYPFRGWERAQPQVSCVLFTDLSFHKFLLQPLGKIRNVVIVQKYTVVCIYAMVIYSFPLVVSLVRNETFMGVLLLEK